MDLCVRTKVKETPCQLGIRTMKAKPRCLVSNLIRSCCAGMKYLPCKRRALSNFIVIPTPINVGIYYVQRPNRKLMLCMKICMTPRDVYKKDWGQHLLTYVGPKG